MSPCSSCGGSKSKTQAYLFTSPSGQTTTYPTEIEARAAQIRSGGGTIKAVAK